MILKGFKEKSIKKHLLNLLDDNNSTFQTQLVETVGVIVNVDEVTDLDMFKSLIPCLNIQPNRLQVIGFSNDKKSELFSWQSCFNAKDIGWKGTVLNTELELFLNKKFDLLISYYTTDILELKLLTAKSKAYFKASIFNQDERLNDLIINTPLNNFDAFKTELQKYLEVFKTLKHET